VREDAPVLAGPTPRLRSSPGLLVDFGGVLTTNVFESFRAFCEPWPGRRNAVFESPLTARESLTPE